MPSLSHRLSRALAVIEALAESLPFLLLTLLLLALAGLKPAHADDMACGGEDLLARLKVEKPAEWQAFMDREKTIAHSGTILFRLDKPGIEPNFVLGTFHVSDPRIVGMPEPARQPFERAKVLIVESDEILDQKAASARLFAEPGLMMLPGTKTLKDFMSPDDAKVLGDSLMARGIPLLSVQKMQPWLVTSMLALSTCELGRKARGEPFLDMKLALDAKAAGKTVMGVETMVEQLKAMTSLPTEFHVKSLVQIARNQDLALDMMETVTQLYLQGKASLIMPASLVLDPQQSAGDVAAMAKFEAELIVKRNYHMADRAAETLDKGSVFMAVGAAHLYGEEGLITLLEKKGFKATPIPVALKAE